MDPLELSKRFAPEYHLDEEMARTSFTDGLMFNAISMGGGPKVDLVPLSEGAFEVSAFGRRKLVPWHGIAVPIIAADDLVIAKLRWAKESESQRQLGDVRAIMSMGLVDEHESYFRNWIAALGLQHVLGASRATRYEA